MATMQVEAVPYRKIVFVCINRRAPNEICCAHRDSEAIAEALKARIKVLGLSRLIRVSKSGCQDVCARGPNVMIFPDYTWYAGVTADDVDRIIQDVTRGLQSPEEFCRPPRPPAPPAPSGRRR